jgi:uncharacterized membrane protein YidH (DUF202 family)
MSFKFCITLIFVELLMQNLAVNAWYFVSQQLDRDVLSIWIITTSIHCVFSVYCVTTSLHVSEVSAAHHHEVDCIYVANGT